MNISIDGLRHNMAKNIKDFYDSCIIDLEEGQIELLDQVARDIRFLGWLSDDENESFNDIHEDIDKYFIGIIKD